MENSYCVMGKNGKGILVADDEYNVCLCYVFVNCIYIEGMLLHISIN